MTHSGAPKARAFRRQSLNRHL